jgi:hypothetical protein
LALNMLGRRPCLSPELLPHKPSRFFSRFLFFFAFHWRLSGCEAKTFCFCRRFAISQIVEGGDVVSPPEKNKPNERPPGRYALTPHRCRGPRAPSRALVGASPTEKGVQPRSRIAGFVCFVCFVVKISAFQLFSFFPKGPRSCPYLAPSMSIANPT